MPIPNDIESSRDGQHASESVPHESADVCVPPKGRHLKVHLVDGIEIHERVIAKGRHQGEKEPYCEVLSCDDLQNLTGKWMKKSRLIDRENDRYQETVTDPRTGAIIHSCDETLSEHTGHGSAKQKNQKHG